MTNSQMTGIRVSLTYIFSEEVALVYRLSGYSHIMQYLWFPETLGYLALFLRTGLQSDYDVFVADCESY